MGNEINNKNGGVMKDKKWPRPFSGDERKKFLKKEKERKEGGK